MARKQPEPEHPIFRDDHFLMIALTVGPPTETSVWKTDFTKAFAEKARELYGISLKDTRALQGLFNQYHHWYQQQTLEQLLKEADRAKGTKDP